jgi:porphobilinogen deaminase
LVVIRAKLTSIKPDRSSSIDEQASWSICPDGQNRACPPCENCPSYYCAKAVAVAPTGQISLVHSHQCAAQDWRTRQTLALIDDPGAHRCADAEREVLWVLNGHCNSPIAGFAAIDGTQMSLTASVLDETGTLIIEASRSGPANRPRELGRAVGLELLAKGAANIIERSRPV